MIMVMVMVIITVVIIMAMAMLMFDWFWLWWWWCCLMLIMMMMMIHDSYFMFHVSCCMFDWCLMLSDVDWCLVSCKRYEAFVFFQAPWCGLALSLYGKDRLEQWPTDTDILLAWKFSAVRLNTWFLGCSHGPLEGGTPIHKTDDIALSGHCRKLQPEWQPQLGACSMSVVRKSLHPPWGYHHQVRIMDINGQNVVITLWVS